MTYVIKTPSGYVTGFSPAHQIVQVTADPQKAKRWATITGATIWLHSYADAGYALTRKTATVEAVNGL